VFVFLNMHAVNRPEVMISNAAERFDEHGNLKDENTRKLIRNLLETLVEWARQLDRGKRTGAAGPMAT
jgi:chromate reductase